MGKKNKGRVIVEVTIKGKEVTIKEISRTRDSFRAIPFSFHQSSLKTKPDHARIYASQS